MIYSGNQLQFVTKSGAYRDGVVTRIFNDSIFLQEFAVRRIPTTIGSVILDTIGSFRYVYHYNELYGFDKPRKGFNLSGSGSALVGGGILLVLASGVVYVADRDKFSPELLAGAAVLGGIGYLLNKVGSRGIIIGKRGYAITYMRLAS